MSAGDETNPNFARVRPATLEDLAGMTRVHVDTWKTTYRGLVPDSFLDNLTYESDLARGFGRWLREPPAKETHLVAEIASGEIVGFAVGGPNREADPDFAGELGAIYVLEAHQRMGVGRALFGGVAQHLFQIGMASMIVWVLEANPYRRFYEKLGGTAVRHRFAPHAGVSLPEVSYGWKNIRELA